jgi:F-type H+/Na+-transporting ATPase subunit alpha
MDKFKQYAQKKGMLQEAAHEQIVKLWEKNKRGDKSLDKSLNFLIDTLKDQSSHLDVAMQYHDVGTVQQVGNGVARISGLPHVGTNELVRFPSGLEGMVLNLDHDWIDVLLLGSDEGIFGGDLVTTTDKMLRVPVGPEVLGRVLDPLGKPLDSDLKVDSVDRYFIEREAPGIIDREKVTTPLQTGYKTLDALIPIGRGQRELILGDRKSGKTTLAVDTIINQIHGDVNCIYVAIGQKKSTTLDVIETLKAHNAMRYTTVIMASPDDPPALRYLAPFTGCAMAEYLVYVMGRDVLIIYDDLSKHANAYREISLLLRRPPGREAYPGDIFYLHSRLLERACKLNEDNGGGSLTALPIVEIQNGNLSSYIPTNLISITDGQIILDTELFNQGKRPSVDIGRSVSRVGGAAQTKVMRSLSGNLRLELSQYAEVAQFMRFGTEMDEATQRQIERGKRVQEILIQPAHAPLSLGEEILSLYSVLHGYLDSVPVEKLREVEKELQHYFHQEKQDLLRHINRSGELKPEDEQDLKEGIETCLAAWKMKSEIKHEENDHGGDTASELKPGA